MSTLSVHSMGNELTQPDWPDFTPQEFDHIVQCYPALEHIQRVLWHSPRPFSTTCIAETATGPVVIKRHDARLRTVADIQTEHQFIAHLHQHHVSVSLPIRTATHQTVIGNKHWTYELFHQASGEDIYRDTMSWQPFLAQEHAYAAGIMLAQLHKASAHFSAPARQTHYLMASDQIARSTSPMTDITTWIAQHPLVAQFLNEYPWQASVTQHLLPLYDELRPYQSLMTPLWGHNDWHASNLLWSTDKPRHVATVIDFGLSNKTSALYDIATAIERNMVDWLNINHKKSLVDCPSLQAFLDGYQHISPLNTVMLAAIAALLPVVHVEYALSEMDYFLSITYSAKNADIAYQLYLLDHARWFVSDEGQQLLTAIKTHQS